MGSGISASFFGWSGISKEALEVLGMIRALLGDLPIEEGLLPVKVYGILPPPDENDSTQGEIG